MQVRRSGPRPTSWTSTRALPIGTTFFLATPAVVAPKAGVVFAISSESNASYLLQKPRPETLQLYAKVLLKFALIATTSTRLIMIRLRNGHGLHAQWCARGAAAAGACWPSPPSAWCSRCVLTSPTVGTALQVRRLVRRPGSRQRLRRRQR